MQELTGQQEGQEKECKNWEFVNVSIVVSVSVSLIGSIVVRGESWIAWMTWMLIMISWMFEWQYPWWMTRISKWRMWMIMLIFLKMTKLPSLHRLNCKN